MSYNALQEWILKVSQGVANTNKAYPFMAHGTDWLAFAHIVIAIAFAGVYYKPVRNIWIIILGYVACVTILPLAIVCGSIREIPFYWILIDCSFGFFGMFPLLLLRYYIKKLSVVSSCVIDIKY